MLNLFLIFCNMYKPKNYASTQLQSIVRAEGETIEQKVMRITHNKEPLKDMVEPIYQERGKGVDAGCNVRTDKWQIAADAMDAASRAIDKKRAAKTVVS